MIKRIFSIFLVFLLFFASFSTTFNVYAQDWSKDYGKATSQEDKAKVDALKIQINEYQYQLLEARKYNDRKEVSKKIKSTSDELAKLTGQDWSQYKVASDNEIVVIPDVVTKFGFIFDKISPIVDGFVTYIPSPFAKVDRSKPFNEQFRESLRPELTEDDLEIAGVKFPNIAKLMYNPVLVTISLLILIISVAWTGKKIAEAPNAITAGLEYKNMIKSVFISLLMQLGLFIVLVSSMIGLVNMLSYSVYAGLGNTGSKCTKSENGLYNSEICYQWEKKASRCLNGQYLSCSVEELVTKTLLNKLKTGQIKDTFPLMKFTLPDICNLPQLPGSNCQKTSDEQRTTNFGEELVQIFNILDGTASIALTVIILGLMVLAIIKVGWDFAMAFTWFLVLIGLGVFIQGFRVSYPSIIDNHWSQIRGYGVKQFAFALSYGFYLAFMNKFISTQNWSGVVFSMIATALLAIYYERLESMFSILGSKVRSAMPQLKPVVAGGLNKTRSKLNQTERAYKNTSKAIKSAPRSTWNAVKSVATSPARAYQGTKGAIKSTRQNVSRVVQNIKNLRRYGKK
jgi:hypothetical protein